MNTEGLQHVGGSISAELAVSPDKRYKTSMASTDSEQTDDLVTDAPDQEEQTEDMPDLSPQFFRKTRSKVTDSTSLMRSRAALQNLVKKPSSSNERTEDKLPVKTTIQLTAKINRDLHARLRIMSFKTHKSMSELIEEFIRQYCAE